MKTVLFVLAILAASCGSTDTHTTDVADMEDSTVSADITDSLDNDACIPTWSCVELGYGVHEGGKCGVQICTDDEVRR